MAVTPKLALRDIGLDTNVFNDRLAPQKDLTTTLTSGAHSWFRIGRAHFANRTSADLIYFQKASSQRSFNVSHESRVDFDMVRFVPRLGGAFLNTRQRPNDEFDTRVQQRHTGVYAGVAVPLGVKAKIEAEFRRQTFDYNTGEFGDDVVAAALNRESRTTSVLGSVDVTPLTTVIVRVDNRHDRFDFAFDRDSNSVRVMPGLEFRPDALISGSVFLGYRRFNTPSVRVADFSGLVAAVELKFVALDMFRVVGRVGRDVDYSMDLEDAFFVSTSSGVEVTQALGLFWDVVGRVRRSALAYQATVDVFGRTDRAWQTGVGLGRRVGTEIRVGVDVDYITRDSILLSRGYDGFRVGGSVLYGY